MWTENLKDDLKDDLTKNTIKENPIKEIIELEKSERWVDDLNDSSYDFLRLVWPVIKNFCGGGETIPVETVSNNDFAKYLDQFSGIDFWQIVNDHGIRGIASRIQWGNVNWRTFTIRFRRFSGNATEYQKRIEAINTGEWLYPYFTCQAYITERRNGCLLGCAVAKTRDIFLAIQEGKYGKQKTTNAEFLTVGWDNVKLVCEAPLEMPLESQTKNLHDNPSKEAHRFIYGRNCLTSYSKPNNK